MSYAQIAARAPIQQEKKLITEVTSNVTSFIQPLIMQLINAVTDTITNLLKQLPQLIKNPQLMNTTIASIQQNLVKSLGPFIEQPTISTLTSTSPLNNAQIQLNNE
jgi:hypothetical protein